MENNILARIGARFKSNESKGLQPKIAELEKSVRDNGADVEAIYKAAGIPSEGRDRANLDSSLSRMNALAFALGCLSDTPTAATAKTTAPATRPGPRSKSKREQYEEIAASGDYVATGKFYQAHRDEIISNAPAGATGTAEVNPLAELDHFSRLVEAGKTGEARAYASLHRAALIEQRDGCEAIMVEQLERESDNDKRHGLARLISQIRKLPI